MCIPWTDETTGAVVIVIEDAVLELDGGGLSGKSSSGHQRVVDYWYYEMFGVQSRVKGDWIEVTLWPIPLLNIKL